MVDETSAENGPAGDIHHNAVPPSITNPLFTSYFRQVMASFAAKLSSREVERETIKEALSEMEPELKYIVTSANYRLQTAFTDYLYRKELEKMRVDYMGRALIRDIEHFFPRNPELAEKLLSTPIEGRVPIQVAEGLITALKNAHGTELIEEYEKACAEKAEQYRNPDDLLINTEEFLADPDVKRLATDVCTRFRLLLHKRSVEEQRKWLLNHISTTAAFQEMKRDLTEEETNIITRVFLKFG
jgi:hypothetical protein